MVRSRWWFWDSREEELVRAIKRLSQHGRAATSGEEFVHEALRPRGGSGGVLLVLAAGVGVLGAGAVSTLPLTAIAVSAFALAAVGFACRRLPAGIPITALLVGVAVVFATRAARPPGAVGPSEGLVEVEGTVLDRPQRRAFAGGELDHFGPPRESVGFRLLLESGIILARVGEAVNHVHAGDRVSLRGHFHPSRSPTNPGERDRRVYGGTVVLTDPGLIVLRPDSSALVALLARGRDEIRLRLAQVLEIFAGENPRRRAFLGAVFLGKRGEGFSELRRTFASCGLAHILAISGLHLAALAATVAAIAAVALKSPRMRLVVMAVVVLGYASLLDPRTSVQRAGLTIGFVLLGLALGTQWRAGPLIGVVAAVVLLVRPEELYGAGFQLSFAVAASLALIAPQARRRWFGQPDRLGSSRRSIFGSKSLDALAAATTAWLVATPIVMHHFAQFAPSGIPSTVAATVPMALVLGLGFPLLLAGSAFEPVAQVGGLVLGPAVDLILGVATAFDHWAPAWFVRPIPWWHVLIAEVGVLAALASPNHRWRRVGLVVVVLAFSAPVVERFLPNETRSFEVCALDVGNGSAILVRAGPSAILFDAGSSSVVDVGRRTIVPALAAMGVRRLDAVVLSHPNADHISGLPAILDLIEVAQVVVSPQFLLAAARGEPVARATVASIRRRGVPIIVVARGDTATFGALSFDVLHPRAEEVCRTVNDSSIVAIIHAEGEQGRVLVCGDVESEAISRVLAREPDLQAEVMELPHHGSWGAEPRAFLESVNPSVVVQSTGHARLAFDRWGPLMDGRERIITARDGAVVVRVPQAVQKKRKPAT